MTDTRGSWNTNKGFNEVVELIPHLRALGIGTVWIAHGPYAKVTTLSPSGTSYNGVPVGVMLSLVVEDIVFCWSIDVINHRLDTQGELDLNGVEALLRYLPPKPLAIFVEILDQWTTHLDQQLGRLSVDTARLSRIKDDVTALRARGDS